MAAFASLGELMGGRSYDPPTISPSTRGRPRIIEPETPTKTLVETKGLCVEFLESNMLVREILRSIMRQIKSETVAGYYPWDGGAERKVRQVEVKPRSKKKGKLCRGQRLVAY
ncbi:MAG: hypothetical protein GY953_27475 [bacterium]|nr:hypothetical protein [bacterium]